MIYAAYLTVNNLITLLWPIYVRESFPAISQVMVWLGLACIMQLSKWFGAHGLTVWATSWAGDSSIRLRQILIGTCLIAALPVLTMSGAAWLGFNTLGIFLCSVIAVGFAYGVIFPCFETLVNNYIPASHAAERATVLSFGSLVKGLFVVMLAIPTGGIGGAKSLVGWVLPAGLLLIVALIGNFVLRREEKLTPVTQVDLETGQ